MNGPQTQANLNDYQIGDYPGPRYDSHESRKWTDFSLCGRREKE
jgi:hypothetical protein